MSETKVFEMTKTWQRDVHTHYYPGNYQIGRASCRERV